MRLASCHRTASGRVSFAWTWGTVLIRTLKGQVELSSMGARVHEQKYFFM